VSITYTYDAGGRRVSRSDGLNTVYYVYDGLNLIEERDGLNNVLVEYVYDGALHPRKAIIGGNAYYFQQDALGNVTALTDETGEIVETYEYDIYGKPTILDENDDPVASPMTPFLFTGHYWDTDIGLYLTMYRAYSPELGRWLTRDPLENAVVIEGLNLYTYCHNNPINMVDPDGFAAVVGAAIGGAVAIGGEFLKHGTNFKCYDIKKIAVGAITGFFGGGIFNLAKTLLSRAGGKRALVLAGERVARYRHKPRLYRVQKMNYDKSREVIKDAVTASSAALAGVAANQVDCPVRVGNEDDCAD
jgi:RHS repeat-associated protein